MATAGEIGWVAAGGAAGTVARFLVGQAVGSALGPGFPWATLGINVVGSFLLGALAGSGAARVGGVPAAALGVGFCGGFTTYSTFSLDAWRLASGGQPGAAAAYVVATLLGGAAGTVAGLLLGARATLT